MRDGNNPSGQIRRIVRIEEQCAVARDFAQDRNVRAYHRNPGLLRLQDWQTEPLFGRGVHTELRLAIGIGEFLIAERSERSDPTLQTRDTLCMLEQPELIPTDVKDVGGLAAVFEKF